MWAWMGIPVPCSRRPSWPRAGRWALAATRRSQLRSGLRGLGAVTGNRAGHLHERGFHPTAIWGAIAAAAACARLNALAVEETRNAIAIAASLAAGVVANFGTMTKPLHVGRTTQAGVLAARLAKSGFTGSPDALEHSAGFTPTHSPSGTPDVDLGNWQLGREWRLPKYGINIKRYPMCYATHRSIDAMLDLV